MMGLDRPSSLVTGILDPAKDPVAATPFLA